MSVGAWLPQSQRSPPSCCRLRAFCKGECGAGNEAGEGKGQCRQRLSQRACPQQLSRRGCVGKTGGTFTGYLLYAGILRVLGTAFPEAHVSSVRRGSDIPDCT